MEEDIEEMEDWMLEGSANEYIKMGESPGGFVCKILAPPTPRKSMYGDGSKTQFVFPVEQLVGKDNVTGQELWEEKMFSTTSKQIRKKLTKLVKQDPEVLRGKVKVSVSWEGMGMNRVYSLSILQG